MIAHSLVELEGMIRRSKIPQHIISIYGGECVEVLPGTRQLSLSQQRRSYGLFGPSDVARIAKLPGLFVVERHSSDRDPPSLVSDGLHKVHPTMWTYAQKLKAWSIKHQCPRVTRAEAYLVDPEFIKTRDFMYVFSKLIQYGVLTRDKKIMSPTTKRRLISYRFT